MPRITVDGHTVDASAEASVIDVLRDCGIETPTLCFGDTIVPKNACRVCVVELEGSRTLVPSCSRHVEDGMVLHTDTDRVRHSRRLVLELLASTVDLSTTPGAAEWIARYDARPERFTEDPAAVRPANDVIVDNDLYVRDYGKCILCYQCVDACGEQWQHTFAIGVAGRGFDATISTEHGVPLPESACVYCGNCIEVCPTGALMAKTEHDMRTDGTWDASAQHTTDTICPFCGVGCTLSLTVQDERIVKAGSPHDHSVTHGNLCIKGRFGWAHVQPPTRR